MATGIKAMAGEDKPTATALYNVKNFKVPLKMKPGVVKKPETVLVRQQESIP